MNLFAFWDRFSEWVMHAGLPTVAAYHFICTSPFLNVSAADAEGVEKVANICLAPLQYLLAGSEAEPILSSEGEVLSYRLKQRFSYEDPMIWIKTAGAYCALPSSLIIGGGLKAIAYFSEGTREKYAKICSCLLEAPLNPRNDFYRSLGIETVDFDSAEKAVSQGYQRRPGDELKLQEEKKALQEIVSLFHEHHITYWLDCGTCLGAYRYGGNIPWDWDVDLAILQPDFENARQVLQKLDPEKYMVQDWSSRDNPRSYLKVYVKSTNALIDIYHFAIDPQEKTIHSILSNEHSVFLPDSWKIRERRFVIPTSFATVFPLKKITFDGVEAFVPNRTAEYLQQRYGENISPAKIYSEETGQYEKDPDHPYWKDLYTR